jgi:hypothetical protein
MVHELKSASQDFSRCFGEFEGNGFVSRFPSLVKIIKVEEDDLHYLI